MGSKSALVRRAALFRRILPALCLALVAAPFATRVAQSVSAGGSDGAHRSPALFPSCAGDSPLPDVRAAVAGSGGAGACASSRLSIVVMTASRERALQRGLASLLRVRGVSPGHIIVAADGGSGSTWQVASALGARVLQHPREVGSLFAGGSKRIARHYKYTFER